MSTQKPLYKRTFLAILICGILYLFVLFALPMVLYGIGTADPWNILITMAFNVILWFVIVPFGLCLPNGRESFRDYLVSIGLKGRFPVPGGFLLGLLAFTAWGVCFLILDLAFGRFDPDLAILTQLATWLIALNAGIFEEIALRGVILTILLKRFKDWPAILICSTLFGLGHAAKMFFGLPALDGLVQVTYAFLFGIFFSYIFVKTRSLIPCILAHILIDALGKVLLEPLIREGVSFAERSTILLVGSVAATGAVMLVCNYAIPRLHMLES